MKKIGKLEVEDILEIHKGDGKFFTFEVEYLQKFDAETLSGFVSKFAVKTYEDVINETDIFLAKGFGEIFEEDGRQFVKILLEPDTSKMFPITGKYPHILGVQIANADLKLSIEYHYGLEVNYNVCVDSF